MAIKLFFTLTGRLNFEGRKMYVHEFVFFINIFTKTFK